jgi:hypothetical protein
MRHDIHVSALVPAYHRHLELATIANAYLPRLQWSFSNLKFRGSARWLDGGAVSLALAYEAAPKAEQDHHNKWLNAAFVAAQDAGLHIAEAYVTRSVGMALFGGGAGAAGGYRASGNAYGAAILGLIGLGVGSLFRAEVPIYRAQYSPGYGWQLVPVRESVPQNLQFRFA